VASAPRFVQAKRGKDARLVCGISGSIEAERRRLQKASTVLIALVYSLSQILDGEQAGDVARVALDLIGQPILALDALAVPVCATL
jgi:hypothetical protein